MNWPDAVLIPGQERTSRSKSKGISDLTVSECELVIAALDDNAPYRLHFKYTPNQDGEYQYYVCSHKC